MNSKLKNGMAFWEMAKNLDDSCGFSEIPCYPYVTDLNEIFFGLVDIERGEIYFFQKHSCYS